MSGTKEKLKFPIVKNSFPITYPDIYVGDKKNKKNRALALWKIIRSKHFTQASGLTYRNEVAR